MDACWNWIAEVIFPTRFYLYILEITYLGQVGEVRWLFILLLPIDLSVRS